MHPSVREEIKKLCTDPWMTHDVHLRGPAKKLHALMGLLCEGRRNVQQAKEEYLRRQEKEEKEEYERRQKEIAARRVKKEDARQAKTVKSQKKSEEEEAAFRRDRPGMDEATLNAEYAAYHRLRGEKIARNKEISKKKRSAMNSRALLWPIF